MAKKQIDMTEGPILGRMILFTLPVLATGVLQLLFNASDLAVVGQFGGADSQIEVGAVGSCGALINLIVNLFMGLAVGAGVIAAQDIGAKRYEAVHKLADTALTVSLIGGVAVGVFGFFATEPLLRLMGTTKEILPSAVPYMKAYFTGMPGCLLYNYLAAIQRSGGDTKHPLLFLAISGVANVGLNILMVAGFKLGALGVGIATSASQYIAAAAILIFMLREEGCCRVTGFALDGERLKKMVLIGLPAGLQGTLFSLSNVIIQSSINAYGTYVVAGNAAGSNLDGFLYIAINSVYTAALTFVGQNVGAGKYARIKKISFLCVGLVTFIGVSLGVVLVVFGEKLLLIFATGENKDAVVKAGMNRLLVMGTTYFLCGLDGRRVRHHARHGQDYPAHDRVAGRLLPVPYRLDRHRLPALPRQHPCAVHQLPHFVVHHCRRALRLLHPQLPGAHAPGCRAGSLRQRRRCIAGLYCSGCVAAVPPKPHTERSTIPCPRSIRRN